jgi:hypothetical protein
LVVICKTSEFLGVESKLSRHLDVGMRQSKLVPSVHPYLNSRCQSFLVGCHIDSEDGERAHQCLRRSVSITWLEL